MPKFTVEFKLKCIQAYLNHEPLPKQDKWRLTTQKSKKYQNWCPWLAFNSKIDNVGRNSYNP